MKTVTSFFLLIFVGLFHFKGADGFPDIENNRVAALFTGGVVIEGEIGEAHVVPPWMRPHSSEPYCYAAYIRTLRNNQYTSSLETYYSISLNHDPKDHKHGPTYAEVRIGNEHWTARRFVPHTKPCVDYKWNVSGMPRNNRIYITLPNGAIYESSLEIHELDHRPASL